MRTQRALGITWGLAVVGMLTGCGSGPASLPDAGGDAELVDFMLSADTASGWVITPDEGDVEGESPDCTGAPYDWPDITMTAYASQFLDRTDETVSVLLKRLDGEAAARIDALRGALRPCAPAGSVAFNGAMVDLVGDDSFAYQTLMSDDLGEYRYSNMLIACGNLILETASISYSEELDQAALEELVAPVVENMRADQDCG